MVASYIRNAIAIHAVVGYGNGIYISFGDEDKNSRDKYEGSATGYKREVDKLRLLVGNLNPSTTQPALRNYFTRYGSVMDVDVVRDRGSGQPRGIAFVKLSTPQELEAVLEARPHHLNGESIVIRPAYLRAPK
ncbi:DAZ-associated protein 1 [Taenia solium]|eukprot:TsM_001038500 transcript=TsM_001038500 gene=TsM_001038500